MDLGILLNLIPLSSISPSGSSSRSMNTRVANSRPPAKTSSASPPFPPPTHGFSLYVILEPSKPRLVYNS